METIEDNSGAEFLFVCDDNAGASQMAQAFAERSGVRATSAGKHATSVLHPNAVIAMKEVGIDISRCRPKSLTPQVIFSATRVITIGCSFENVCPQSMQLQMREKTIHWDWKGLGRRNIDGEREIRDEIRRRVEGLLIEAR